MKNTLKKQVEYCLQEFPHTRNSDITLMLAVWQVSSGVEIDRPFDLKRLYLLPTQENIKRIRAQFNHEGLYWPTELKIARARGIQEDIWRVFMGYPKVAATQTPTRDESYTQQVQEQMSSRPDDLQDRLIP